VGGRWFSSSVFRQNLFFDQIFEELRMVKKAAALFLICVSIATWVSCGNSTSSYLYAAIPATNAIVAYREDPNSGILTQLATSPITAGAAVQAIAIHPSQKFLYAANSGEGDISLFTIGSDGTLSEKIPRTMAGVAPTLLTMDSAGKFLYVGNSGTFDVSIYSINSTTGVLTQVGSNYPIGVSPLNMKVTPTDSFLYVTGVGTPGLVEGFVLVNGVPPANNSQSPVVPGSPFVTGTAPYGLAIDPTGKFLYTANKLDNSISEFTIGSNGALTPIANSPVGETYISPVSLLIDNSGKYLYVANQGSTNVAAYSIGTDGSLALLSGSPFASGAQPNVIATDAVGHYLFVGNLTNPKIQSFGLSSGSGTLTSVYSYTIAGAATSIAVAR
jgi:6-phosphogluconolactonase